MVFISSGAAFGAYSGWGSYGTSKAALTHLCAHLAVEEPSITSVAISPGKVDTGMQKLIRDDGKTGMSPEVHKSFVDEHESGRLLDPNQPGAVIAKLVDGATSDLNGKHFRYVKTKPDPENQCANIHIDGTQLSLPVSMNRPQGIDYAAS